MLFFILVILHKSLNPPINSMNKILHTFEQEMISLNNKCIEELEVTIMKYYLLSKNSYDLSLIVDKNHEKNSLMDKIETLINVQKYFKLKKFQNTKIRAYELSYFYDYFKSLENTEIKDETEIFLYKIFKLHNDRLMIVFKYLYDKIYTTFGTKDAIIDKIAKKDENNLDNVNSYIKIECMILNIILKLINELNEMESKFKEQYRVVLKIYVDFVFNN